MDNPQDLTISLVPTVAGHNSAYGQMALDPVTRKMYFYEGWSRRIVRADLDGSDWETFLSNILYCSGLQVVPLPEPTSILLLVMPLVAWRRRTRQTGS